jgi:folate-binding protein YgfZ
MMTTMDGHTAFLADRGVVRVAGPDARMLLDNLITCDLDRVKPGQGRHGALLTPQGKIMFDFIINEAEEADGGYFLDCLAGMAGELVKRLSFYKLRAKVAIEDMSAELGVLAGWGDAVADDESGLLTPDPREPKLGWRLILPRDEAEKAANTPAGAYHALRIGLGVPEGGKDFLFNDAFPHEALMDRLAGVDFDKGCYVGQEVVSRMQHRGTARTRIVKLRYPDGFAPEAGAAVTAGERVIGKAGSGAGGIGLATIRLDKLDDALAAGEEIRAGGLAFRVEP